MGPERLGFLLDRHAAALELYARQWCALPEDVVQEAFLKLARQVTPPAQPLAWLYRVVRNGAISAGRAESAPACSMPPAVPPARAAGSRPPAPWPWRRLAWRYSWPFARYASASSSFKR